MANTLLALSGLVTEPPEELEYETVYAAVTATARGRWFLAEYNNRQRQSDIALLLGAMARVEAVVCGKAEDLVPVALVERLRAAVPLIERLDSAILAAIESENAAAAADALLRELRELIEGALTARQARPAPGEAALSAAAAEPKAVEPAAELTAAQAAGLDDDPLWQGGLFEPVENLPGGASGEELPHDFESAEAVSEALVREAARNSEEATGSTESADAPAEGLAAPAVQASDDEASHDARGPPRPLSLIDAPVFLFAALPDREVEAGNGESAGADTAEADSAEAGGAGGSGDPTESGESAAAVQPAEIATVIGALLPAADFADMAWVPETRVEVLPEMAIESASPIEQSHKPSESDADPMAALRKLKPEQLRALFG